MILAAIDIGTNACRLLISEVIDEGKPEPEFNKLNLVRVPLRLGFDVFETGQISKQKKDMMLQTMKAYAHLMNAYGVQHHMAVATSAMRDAKNCIHIQCRLDGEEFGPSGGSCMPVVGRDAEGGIDCNA